MIKHLASLGEVGRPDFVQCMKTINHIARKGGLQGYTTFSRIWEYPWVWFQMESLKGHRLKVLDVGSERSPFPWFLASQGFDVMVSDVTANFWRLWQRASRQLGVDVRMRILDTQHLHLPTASVDIYMSVSVIEHVPNKARVIAEAARVLRPGGLLVMTFDICEPDMGMTFPEWNGRALTMREFDELFRNTPWFEPGSHQLPWNTADIPQYLSWHRTTAPWHNYVTGAAVVRRNDQIWAEPSWKGRLQGLRGQIRTAASVVNWYLWHSPRMLKRFIPVAFKNPLRALMSIWRRLRTPPLESLPNAPGMLQAYPYLNQHPDLERKPGGWLYKGRF